MNNIEQVYVRYWHGTKIGNVPWEHGEEIDYSLRFAVAQRAINEGLNVMFLVTGENKEFLTIFIDDKRFGQR